MDVLELVLFVLEITPVNNCLKFCKYVQLQSFVTKEIIYQSKKNTQKRIRSSYTLTGTVLLKCFPILHSFIFVCISTFHYEFLSLESKPQIFLDHLLREYFVVNLDNVPVEYEEGNDGADTGEATITLLCLITYIQYLIIQMKKANLAVLSLTLSQFFIL